MTEPEGIPIAFQLPSGKVLLTGFTAISDAELKEAKQIGSPGLIDRLRVAGFHPVNDPHRRSLDRTALSATSRKAFENSVSDVS
jgi:hypothetical protein